MKTNSVVKKPASKTESVDSERYRPMLAAFAKVVMAMERLTPEERRRVINASQVAFGATATRVRPLNAAGEPQPPTTKKETNAK